MHSANRSEMIGLAALPTGLWPIFQELCSYRYPRAWMAISEEGQLVVEYATVGFRSQEGFALKRIAGLKTTKLLLARFSLLRIARSRVLPLVDYILKAVRLFELLLVC
jgi:hypothetical protein